MQAILEQFLDAPPAHWDYMLSQVEQIKALEAIKESDEVIQRLALIRGYLEGRCLFNKSHCAAVKDGNKALVSVRRMLGYAYPELGQFSF